MLAVIRSATDTIGLLTTRAALRRAMDDWAADLVRSRPQSHGSAVTACLPRVIRIRPR